MTHTIHSHIVNARQAIESLRSGSSCVDRRHDTLAAFVDYVEAMTATPGKPVSCDTIPDGYKMSPHASASYADHIKYGWTDEQLLSHGHMRRKAITINVNKIQVGDIIANNCVGGVVMYFDAISFELASSLVALHIYVRPHDFIGGLLARDGQMYRVVA